MKTIVVLLLLSATGFAQSQYQREAQAGAKTLERMDRENAASDQRKAEMAQEERQAAAERYNLDQACQNAAIGAGEYAQIRTAIRIQTPDGVPLTLNAGDCFPVIRRDNGSASVGVLGASNVVPTANLSIVTASDSAKQLYANASRRLISAYSDVLARQRAAYWAQQEKAAVSRSNDDMVRQNREQKEKEQQDARVGAAWLKQRALESELNRLRAEKIMRQQNGQQ
jgi:hypothetical protein